MEVLNLNRDEILAKSRQENIGICDERELAAIGSAAKVGMLVGGILCAVLVFVSEVFFNNPGVSLAAWMVYFAMRGSHDIAFCVKMQERKRLVSGIIELVASFVFAVALVVFSLC